jgi:hypothetical protein
MRGGCFRFRMCLALAGVLALGWLTWRAIQNDVRNPILICAPGYTWCETAEAR